MLKAKVVEVTEENFARKLSDVNVKMMCSLTANLPNQTADGQGRRKSVSVVRVCSRGLAMKLGRAIVEIGGIGARLCAA